MTIRLVDSGWATELTSSLRKDASSLRIVCPFIKAVALDRLLATSPKSIQVITRFHLGNFASGVSDIAALRRLLEAGATVRGVRNLHAKLYLFGRSRVILTSTNLTEAALSKNHELGMIAEEKKIITACETYFDNLWRRAGANLRSEQLDVWGEKVAHNRLLGGRVDSGSELGDFGADAGVPAESENSAPVPVDQAPQAFVKFLGEGSNRVPLSFPTLEEVKLAGCHWAVGYPALRRPTSVRDDAVIFMGRLTRNPNDVRIFGLAMGMKYQPGRDDATATEIAVRGWKKDWPRYIRVHHAQFVAGTMANGVSLNHLMASLGPDSFLPTQRNSAVGHGNTNPRKSYRQQPAVELSREGFSWLTKELQSAFDVHGIVPQDDLNSLDWPPLTGT